jgi:molybdopterin-guanine dinucleotide biosynthesis protein A
MTTKPATGTITGLILAGGRGSRMGGIDKGLADLAGRPMVAHVLDRLRPQVDDVLVNANRHADAYRAYGFPVVPDAEAGYPGPLAGFAAGLAAAATPWVVTVPCDCPLLPTDLVQRLRATQAETGAEIVSAHDGSRLQPVFTLLQRGLLDSLESFMADGERKIDRWFGRHEHVVADFSDQPQAFENVNRPGDRDRIEARWTRNPTH